MRLSVAVLIAAFALAPVAFAQTQDKATASPAAETKSEPKPASTSPLLGSWGGTWEGARTGGLELVFETEKTGTLVTAGHGSGSDPKPLTNVSYNDKTRSLRFGAGTWDIDRAELSPDGKQITGRAWYRGTQYTIKLTKK